MFQQLSVPPTRFPFKPHSANKLLTVVQVSYPDQRALSTSKRQAEIRRTRGPARSNCYTYAIDIIVNNRESIREKMGDKLLAQCQLLLNLIVVYTCFFVENALATTHQRDIILYAV